MLSPSEFLMRSGRHACPDPQAGTAVIVITGASSGIGRSTANLFAQHGWRVGLIARGRPGLQATFDDVSRHGAMAAMEQADVADLGALEAAAARIERTLGPIDAWINCAGNGTYGRFLDTPAEEFQRVTEVTYMGTVNGTRVALRRFLPRDRGSIVNVCSAVAFHGMPLLSAYSGAKHAVRGFGQSVRAELAQDRSHVRLTSVFPPAVNTPFFDHAISHMGQLGRPMSPVYQPEVVAEAIRLALISGRAEMPVTSTAILFSISARFMPGLVARAIRKLGYGGQLTDQATLQERHAPTLFAASETASPARGAFDALARTGSMHIRILGVLARWRAPGRLTPQPGKQPPPGLPADETPVQEHALD